MHTYKWKDGFWKLIEWYRVVVSQVNCLPAEINNIWFVYPRSLSQTCWNWFKLWLWCLVRNLQSFLGLLFRQATHRTRQLAHQLVSGCGYRFPQMLPLMFQSVVVIFNLLRNYTTLKWLSVLMGNEFACAVPDLFDLLEEFVVFFFFGVWKQGKNKGCIGRGEAEKDNKTNEQHTYLHSPQIKTADVSTFRDILKKTLFR